MDNRIKEMVAAHELGHDVLHRDIAQIAPMHDVFLYGRAISRTEKEANEFSANLLIPDTDILEEVAYGSDYFALSRVFGYPLELIQYKLNSMKQRGFDMKINDVPDSGFLGY